MIQLKFVENPRMRWSNYYDSNMIVTIYIEIHEYKMKYADMFESLKWLNYVDISSYLKICVQTFKSVNIEKLLYPTSDRRFAVKISWYTLLYSYTRWYQVKKSAHFVPWYFAQVHRQLAFWSKLYWYPNRGWHLASESHAHIQMIFASSSFWHHLRGLPF